MMIRQILLSSSVYNSHFSLPDSIEKPVLVYRYSDNMCEGCIFEDLENLKIFQNKIGKNRILILPAYNRQNLARLLYELADFNYKNITVESLSVLSQQYFAVINNNDKVEMVFFPMMGYSSITQAYFNEVENIYYKSKNINE